MLSRPEYSEGLLQISFASALVCLGESKRESSLGYPLIIGIESSW